MSDVIESRIVTDAAVMGGAPVVEGTRVPVANVLSEIDAGRSRAEIFRIYPSLPLDGIEACIAWARDAAGRRD